MGAQRNTTIMLQRYNTIDGALCMNGTTQHMEINFEKKAMK